MAVVKELIRIEDDDTISFGNYELDTKTKLADFAFDGDLYKVKTFREITRLEKNGAFLYESTPGTAVSHFKMNDTSVEFIVEGFEDSQITLDLEPDAEYKVLIDDLNAGRMKTQLGGKLTLTALLENGKSSKIKIVKG